jgi:hypothetical protein
MFVIFSSTKLVIKSEQDLPGTEGGSGERVWWHVGKMTQTMCGHVNK